MRGVRFVRAATLVAESGDLTRGDLTHFDSARRLNGPLGLVPRGVSSGQQTAPGFDHEGRQPIRASHAGRSRLDPSASGADYAHDRHPANTIAHLPGMRGHSLSAKYPRRNALRVNHNKTTVAIALSLGLRRSYRPEHRMAPRRSLTGHEVCALPTVLRRQALNIYVDKKSPISAKFLAVVLFLESLSFDVQDMVAFRPKLTPKAGSNPQLATVG